MNMLEKRRAEMSDLVAIRQFYHQVILQQQSDEYGPGWTEGVYPSDEDYLDHVEKGEFFIGLKDGEIAAAGVITLGEEDNYHQGNWKVKVADDRVAILHLFAAGKKYRGQGVAREMLAYLIAEAGKKAEVIHLDVAAGNLPAGKLYEKNGFELIGRYEIWYPDTGMMAADFYELDMRKGRAE